MATSESLGGVADSQNKSPFGETDISPKTPKDALNRNNSSTSKEEERKSSGGRNSSKKKKKPAALK